MALLYYADPVRGRAWQAIFAAEAPDIDFRIWPDAGDLREVTSLATWLPSANIFAQLPNLEVLFSIGAGIDQFDASAIPDGVTIVRMIEPGIAEGMVEYVTFASLALHRHMLDYRAAQLAQRWSPITLVPASRRRIGIMGLGNLGKRVIGQLRPFGFPISAWSRSQHEIPGVATFHGDAELRPFLRDCDILICLLPLTAETRGILNSETLNHLPRGSGLINVGRGPHLLEQDLLEALDAGQLNGAVLDVCEQEPLPEGHPFWHHPRILLTPHVASMTRTDSAAQALIANVRHHRSGEAMDGQVDRTKGY